MSVVFQSSSFETFAAISERDEESAKELLEAINALKLQAVASTRIVRGTIARQQVACYNLEYKFSDEDVEVVAIDSLNSEK